MRCQLYACTGTARAVLELPGGRQIRVCARHAHAARERGHAIIVPDGTEETDA